MMSTQLLAVFVVGPTALVVAAIFAVLWRERRSAREARTAMIAGVALAVWAAAAIALAIGGYFRPPDTASVPPIGIALAAALLFLTGCVTASTSLRRLLTNQADLCRLHLWRLEGIVFLVLMMQRQMPALWAVPAGTGDLFVGATAFWMADQVGTPRSTRRLVFWHLFGVADLIVAVGLGIMTNPGPTQVFMTTPTSELVTNFPLALVPTFLVPLAFMLHIVSLWQLFGWRWVSKA